MTPNFLYHNEGRGVFKEVALAAGVAVASDGKPRAGMGTDFGDYDGDGRLDLFVTNHELEMHTLFRNLGKGLFADATSESRVGLETLPFVGFGTLFPGLRQRRRPRPGHRQRARDERLRPLQAGREGSAAQAAVQKRRRRTVQGGRPPVGSRLRGGRRRPHAGRRRHRQRRRSGSAGRQQRWHGRSAAQRRRTRQQRRPRAGRWDSQQSRRHRRQTSSHGRRHDPGARGQGRVELPWAERPPRAFRARPGDARSIDSRFAGRPAEPMSFRTSRSTRSSPSSKARESHNERRSSGAEGAKDKGFSG